MTRFITTCFLAFSLFGSTHVLANERVYGVALPREIRPLEEEGRYISKEDWGRTLRYFSKAYPEGSGIIWQTLETPPEVKAISIKNTARARAWDAINIYQVRGQVFIKVLPSQARR